MEADVAAETVLFLSLEEDQDGGYGEYAVLPGQLWVFVCIDIPHVHAWKLLLKHFDHLRLQYLTYIACLIGEIEERSLRFPGQLLESFHLIYDLHFQKEYNGLIGPLIQHHQHALADRLYPLVFQFHHQVGIHRSGIEDNPFWFQGEDVVIIILLPGRSDIDRNGMDIFDVRFPHQDRLFFRSH